MKTFYLTTAMLMSTIVATAQTEKGTLNINGQFGSNTGGQYYTVSNGLIKGFSMKLNPNVGYFVKNNWEVGAGVLFGMTRSRYTNELPEGMEKDRFNQFGLKAYSKYYFGNGSFKPYVTLEVLHTWQSGETIFINGNTRSYNSTNWNAGAGVGAAWFVSPKIALFSQLTYNRNLEQIRYATGALNLNFGVQINLGKK